VKQREFDRQIGLMLLNESVHAAGIGIQWRRRDSSSRESQVAIRGHTKA